MTLAHVSQAQTSQIVNGIGRRKYQCTQHAQYFAGIIRHFFADSQYKAYCNKQQKHSYLLQGQ